MGRGSRTLVGLVRCDRAAQERCDEHGGSAASAMKRKFWGWGYEGEGPSEEQQRRHRAGARGALRDRPADPGAGAAHRGDRAARAARRAARVARRASARPTPRSAPATPTASRFRDVVRALAPRVPPIRPTWSRFPRARGRRRRRCSTGAATRDVAAIPYGGGSSVVGGVEPPAGDALRGVRHASTSARSTACSRSTAPRARRASRPASSGPRSRTSCAPHGSTLRHFPQSFEFSHARRLDRDALGRPLRDALHAHRRLRRVAARGDARAA